jgi:CubicO group peptidase (beta-lactamase class C family)
MASQMNKRYLLVALIASASASTTAVAVVPMLRSQQAPQAQSAAPAPASDAAIASKIEEYMQAQARVNRFSGTILLARKGVPIVAKGYGWANAEWEVPNTPQTKFRLGSITKQFTSMAILQLQEQGKLKVQDSICSFVSPCPDAWKPVTVHHLLTHTSGIPSYTGFPTYTDTMMVPKTLEQMVASFRDLPLEFEPGSQFKYDNSGYFLLGVILEKVSGKTYENVLRDQIFTPLGMKDSGYDTSSEILPRRAAGYARKGSDLVNAAYLDMVQPFAAGALYSTVEDLLKWDQALYTDKLLPAAAREALFTPFKNGYAYGWSVPMVSPRTFGRRQISHGGGINGFATMIVRLPDDNVTAIVLANVQEAPSGAIARDLLAIFFSQKYQIPVERTVVGWVPGVQGCQGCKGARACKGARGCQGASAGRQRELVRRGELASADFAARSSRAPIAANSGLGPDHFSSSTDSNSEISVRSVARSRNRKAFERSRTRVVARVAAFAALTCHSRGSAGIASRWPKRARTAAVDFGPQPCRPG